MTLVRTVKKENPFVQLDKYFLNDERLSWGAKGILAYLLSKPDGWKIRKEDLIKKSDDGKTKIETALLNLMACGYVNWYQERNEDGTLGEWVYDLYERPEYNPNLVFCLEVGAARINERKNRVKKRNEEMLKAPKVDNQFSASPKVDNPLSDYPTSDNHPYSNNDFINNDFNNNENKEEEEEKLAHLTDLTKFFIQTIDKNSNENYIKSKFAEWLKLLPYDVIKMQIEICAEKGGKSWSYVQTALLRLQESNVYTIEQLEQKLADHKNSNLKKPSKGQSKPKRSEQTPNWYEDPEKYYGGAAAAAENTDNVENPDIEAKKKDVNSKLASLGIKIK